MDHIIITIGRKYGSGGHEIGARLAKKLGIAFYDRELIAIAAEKTGCCETFVKHNDEKTPGFFARTMNYGRGNVYTQPSPEDNIFASQAQTILELADNESCVIVGRCADYILRDRKDTINLFLYAPLEDRIQRKIAISDKPLTESEAKKKIITTDKQREKYYNFYTGERWGFCSNYDLCLDTSKVGIWGSIDLIINFIESRNNKGIMPD